MRSTGDSSTYHLQELAIARDTHAAGHVMPELPKGTSRVLDVGCGAGQTLIASELSSDTFACGIDIDPAALRLGRSLTNVVSFVCSRAEELPFNDDYFDVVISRIALPYTDIPRALAEMSRVLKPGGHVWLVVHSWKHPLKSLVEHTLRLEMSGAIHQLYVIAHGLALHVFGAPIRAPYGARVWESFQTRRGMRASLLKAGFDDIVSEEGAFFVLSGTKHGEGGMERAGTKRGEARMERAG
jgi:ubiquinone/menaquinone biosynthesis C-methylase UbiE